MTVCNRCGKENQDHYKFCLGCGAELTADAPTARRARILPRVCPPGRHEDAALPVVRQRRPAELPVLRHVRLSDGRGLGTDADADAAGTAARHGHAAADTAVAAVDDVDP